jgi:YD repeat-containing protein
VTNATFAYSNNFVLTNSFTNTITGYTLITDVFGKTTRYGYGNGQITNVLDPLGFSFSQEWYADNASPPGYPRSVKKQTDRRGLVTEYQYDTFGNITNTITTGSLTGPGGVETASERAFYNTNQLPVLVIDPLGDSNVIRYHATFNFSPEEIVTYKQGQAIVTNRGFYDSFTNVVTYGNTTWTNLALGLMRTVVRAYGSPEAATNEWFYD